MLGITSYIKIGAVVILASAIAGAFWYFKWSQSEMETLRANNQTLQTELENTQRVVENLQASMKEAAERFASVNRQFQNSRENTTRLRDALSKNNLGFLAENKPGLVSTIVNNASKDANRCFEIVSGAPLTSSERNATKPSEINKSCPELANPNYRGRAE